MTQTKLLTIKCYRQKHGDVDGAPDMSVLGADLEKAKEVTGRRLLALAGGGRYQGKPPHTADLVSRDGSVIARFRAVPTPQNKISVEEVPL